MRTFPRIAATLLLFVCAESSAAQVLLRGTVHDASTSESVTGASIRLEGPGGTGLARRVTGADGTFSFLLRGPGPFRLRVERIGYRPTTVDEIWSTGRTLPDVAVRLALAPVELEGVTATGRGAARSPTLAGFERRRHSASGWFLTREEIEQQNPTRVSGLLARAPGVRLQRGVVYMSRATNCPAEILVDGFHLNRSLVGAGGRRGSSPAELVRIDEVLRPGAIAAIEVYQGLSSVPPELRAGHPACGLVAVWTRRGP
jgi:hypothetical protein